MLNAVWIAMVVGALLCGAYTGKLEAVAQASTDSAIQAVQFVVRLIGVMAFWLGLVRVLQHGGLLRVLARAMGPVTRRLFPDVPPDHPAMSMMIMNIAANVLGLGNAATPFGLKAMTELDKLNPHKGTATNAMALFLAINTSSLALLPTGIIALRASLGATSPGSILVPSILATSFSTLVAIIAVKSLQRVPAWRAPAVPAPAAAPAEAEARPEADASADDGVDVSEAEKLANAGLAPVSRSMTAIGLVLAVLAVTAIVYALLKDASRTAGGEPVGLAGALDNATTHWLLVPLIVGFVVFGVIRGVKIYDVVVEGAREGFQIAMRFAPYFVVILVAIGMFRASGALDMLVQALSPVTSMIGMPAETLPMALLRPLSGSGAYAVAGDIMKTHGADSLVGQIVSTMQGSTETTFYVLALYFGVVRIKNARHTVAACLTADLAGVIGAVWACRLVLT